MIWNDNEIQKKSNNAELQNLTLKKKICMLRKIEKRYQKVINPSNQSKKTRSL